MTETTLSTDECRHEMRSIDSSGQLACIHCNERLRPALVATQPRTYVSCPFCGENDFDRIGLKVHLLRWCEDFDKLEEPKRG